MAALTWVNKLALTVCLLGLKAFVFGIVAEHRKPPFGSRVGGKQQGDSVMCQFPAAAADVAVVMGILSVISLVLATAVGHVAALYPYKGSINVPAAAAPRGALFQRTSFVVFFLITQLVSASALAMLLWATIAQGRHRNVQYQMQYDGDDMEEDTTTCPLPAAKTNGLFGGGALLALDATLLWLVCQMLALNARADYLDLHGDGDDDADDNKKANRFRQAYLIPHSVDADLFYTSEGTSETAGDEGAYHEEQGKVGTIFGAGDEEKIDGARKVREGT